MSKYTKEELEEALKEIPFIELVQVGDLVTNKNAKVVRDKVIEKGIGGWRTLSTPYFICETSGKWTGTTPGWVLEPEPLKKEDK